MKTRGILEGFGGVYDLHVWQLSQGNDVMSVHMHCDGSVPEEEVLRQAQNTARRFGLSHSTIQVEGYNKEFLCNIT